MAMAQEYRFKVSPNSMFQHESSFMFYSNNKGHRSSHSSSALMQTSERQVTAKQGPSVDGLRDYLMTLVAFGWWTLMFYQVKTFQGFFFLFICWSWGVRSGTDVDKEWLFGGLKITQAKL